MASATRKHRVGPGSPRSYWDRRGGHLPLEKPGSAVARGEWVCPLPPAGRPPKQSAWKRYFVPEMGFVRAPSWL